MVKKEIDALKLLNSSIKHCLQSNELYEVEEQLSKYAKAIKNADWYTLQATYYYQLGNFPDAVKILEEGIIQHPFNFFINVNLAITLEMMQDFLQSMKYYAYACKFARNEKERNHCLESIKRVVSILSSSEKISIDDLNDYIKKCNLIIAEVDSRVFPLGNNGQTLVRQVMNPGTDNEFMVNMYKSFNITDIDQNQRFYHKIEIFKGKKIHSRHEIELHQPCILPISLITPETRMQIAFSNQSHKFTNLEYHKYHYLRFSQAGKLTIEADKPLFVGNPIELFDIPRKPKLVLKIFVDGLSYKFLNTNGLEAMMPNTYSYFKKGFIADKCFATSEWTLPSKASINTGNYSTTHKLLHPNYNYRFEEHNKLMSEYMKEAGYFTTKIDTNWRTTPTFGYYKGFDRILYQNFMGGMDCRDVIMETIEHIEAFYGKNNFVSISLMDLHNVPDAIEDTLLGQVNTSIEDRLNKQLKGETSVLTKYDESKIVKYEKEIKRLDVFLGILFDYLNKKFSDDEVLVVLHSDHGQTFLEKEDSITHDSRRLVPFMVKGRQVPKLMSDEIIETVDILPTMLSLCDIELPNNIDGNLPKCFGGEKERKFAITHVIHPNQPYRVVISDETHTFYLETKENVENDLSINLEDYTVTLVNHNTQLDDLPLYQDKVGHYEQVVFDHCKNFLRWSNLEETGDKAYGKTE